MAKTLTQLQELTVTTAIDWVHVADVSDTSQNVAGSSKKVQIGNLLPSTGVAVGEYGSDFAVPVLTLNAKGQVTGAANRPIVLPNTGVTPGTYGSTTRIPILTVDERGRITEASNVAPVSRMTFVSDYGAPNANGDAATIQAAFNAARDGNRTLVFDVPPGQSRAEYIFDATVQDTTTNLSSARITSVDTSTGLVTFDRTHGRATGDVISFVGTDLGSGGGTTELKAYTEVFARVASPTTLYAYDTYARALAGGPTGLIVPSTGATTAATLITLTMTSTLTAGGNSFTVADASNVVPGDTINFTGSGATVYPKVDGVVGNTITLTANYTGSTVANGATVWLSAATVSSLLSIEQGTTASFIGPSTGNSSFGQMIVESISGMVVHFNQPPNSNLPTPGASQTLVINTWLDPKYLDLNFHVIVMPGVTLKKKSTLNAAMMVFQYMNGLRLTLNGEIWGKTYGFTPDPGIVNGDDGIRVFGCCNILFEGVGKFRYLGDSAWRFHSSSYFAGARSATYPNAGTYANNIVINGIHVLDCFQTSTTNTSNYYQGGGNNITYMNCKFERIGGAIKFATRAPGSESVKVVNCEVDTSGRHGFELDSYSDYRFDNVRIRNCAKYGVFLIANNLQQIGHEFHKARFRNMIIEAGALTGNSTSSGGIYISMDTFPDGTRWDYKGLKLEDIDIYGMPALALPINIATGSYLDPKFKNIHFTDCLSTTLIRATPRVSPTSGFVANWAFEDVHASNCVGTQASLLYFVPANGAAGSYVRGIHLDNCTFNNRNVTLGVSGSNLGRLVWADYVEDLHVNKCWWEGYGGGAVYIQTEAKNVYIEGNDFHHLNSSGASTILMNGSGGVDGVFIRGNTINQPFGTSWVTLGRQCQNVVIANDNVLTRSVAKGISVGNIPVKTSPDGLRRVQHLTAAPTSGTWESTGDEYILTNAAAGGDPGARCTTSGTLTAITATGDSVTGQNTITNISLMTNICVGMYITHAGFSGTLKIASLGADSVTVTTAAGGATTAASDQTAASLTVSAPVFKNHANLDP